MTLNADGTKTCPRCGETKSAVGGFYSTKSSRDGFSGYCIPCTKQKAVEWQKANPDKKKETDRKAAAKKTPEQREAHRLAIRAWAVKNHDRARELAKRSKRRQKDADPQRFRFHNAINNNRVRARKLGVENTLQFVDWMSIFDAYAGSCAYCGASKCVIDVDHIHPMTGGGGNTHTNVVPACRICNAHKGTKTLGEYAVEISMDIAAFWEKHEQVLASLSDG